VLDAGAITMPSQVTIIEGLVNDAGTFRHFGPFSSIAPVAKGAKAVVGGKKHPTLPGLHFQPTVLLDVTQEMKVVNEEAFGPLMPIVKFTTEEQVRVCSCYFCFFSVLRSWKFVLSIRCFADGDQVIAMANRSVYALAANVFSSDYKRAERVAKQVLRLLFKAYLVFPEALIVP
jgi:uncharacterized radical SAM superfamily Fe-S cluster-containing enzyme